MDMLTEFRRENPNVTRKVAEEYFYTLTYMLTGGEHKHLMKTDRIYMLFDRYLLKNEKEYPKNSPDEMHIWLKDYAKGTCSESSLSAGTLLERFPAIRRQLDDLLELHEDAEIKLDQKSYFRTREDHHKMYIVHSFIKQGCYYPGQIFPGEHGSRDYVDQNTFEEMLRAETFEEGKEIFNKESKEKQMQIMMGSERIFPNERFVKSIREIVDWYKKCNQAGFDPSKLVVRENARTLYVPGLLW